MDRDLGQATIVYDDPADGTVERTVQNEHIAYVQDHWTIKTAEDEQGNDVVRRIPHHRVHYVERSVEEFESEIETIQRRVQSIAEDLRTKFLGSGDSGNRSESFQIDVESDDEAEDGK